MKDWKVMKNLMAEKPCWQIYYNTKDGKRRYFDAALTYPTAMALIECVSDQEIRDAVMDAWKAPLLGPNPWDGKWDIWQRIGDISKKHGCERIPEYGIRNVMMAEDED